MILHTQIFAPNCKYVKFKRKTAWPRSGCGLDPLTQWNADQIRFQSGSGSTLLIFQNKKIILMCVRKWSKQSQYFQIFIKVFFPSTDLLLHVVGFVLNCTRTRKENIAKMRTNSNALSRNFRLNPLNVCRWDWWCLPWSRSPASLCYSTTSFAYGS